MTEIERGSLARSRTPGPTLYFTSARPAQPVAPVAMVAMVHGYADHGGRYEHVQRAWADRGLASVIVDLRGHGRSEGPRGACRQFAEYHDDMRELVELATKRANGLPLLMFAHSFGGLVATHYALSHPMQQLKALVLSNPYLRLQVKVPKAKLVAARIASSVVPFLSLASGLTGKDVTRDPERAKAYDADPLVFPTANSRWFMETQQAQAQVLARARELDVPLHVTLGLDDRIVTPAAGRELFEAAASKDKTLDERPGGFHEVLNDPDWESIAGAMAEWMLGRVK